jgi:predicted ATP-grasp superfamily ATP-dependent carboligase
MRLLVTNTRTGQAYAIIRSLRPHAEWISATMYGSNWLTAHTAAGAFSRLVDSRYVVTSPEEDWAAGKIQIENTQREERYIREIEKICTRDRIDTIFPSYDPQVYILVKNRQRLAKLGVRVMAPDYETLQALLDKSETLKLAAAAGFPHPETYLVDEHDLAELAGLVEPPWVVRPTASARSRGMVVIKTLEDLEPAVKQLQTRHKKLIFQEYIPGHLKQNFYMLIGRDHEVLSMISPKVLRTSHRIYRNSSAAVLFNHQHEYDERVKELVRSLNWHGGLTLQTKIDSRDGTLKLMEINPRFGSHAWYATELGIDTPLMYLRSFQGESVEPVREYPGETLMLEPIEDFFGLFFNVIDRIVYQFGRLLGRRTTDPDAVPASIFNTLSTLKKDYIGPHSKAYMPQFRYALKDPLVFILKCWAVLRYELSQLRRAGI